MPIDADTARRFASGIDPALAARGFDFSIAADQLDEAAVALVLVQESELVLLESLEEVIPGDAAGDFIHVIFPKVKVVLTGKDSKPVAQFKARAAFAEPPAIAHAFGSAEACQQLAHFPGEGTACHTLILASDQPIEFRSGHGHG